MKVQISFRQPGDTQYYRYKRENDAYNLLDVVKDVFQSTSVQRLEVLIETVPDDPVRNSTTSFTLEKKPTSTPVFSVEPVKPEAARADGGGKTTIESEPPVSSKVIAHDPDAKVCGSCHKKKPVDDFNKRGETGRQSQCRDCMREYLRNRKKKHSQRSKSEPILPSGGDHRGPTPGQQAPTAAIKRPTPRWTKNDDAILKTQYDSIGIVGVHAERLLSDDFTLTEIKQRCQHLRIIDAAGVRIQRQLHKKDDNTQMEEDLDV